MPVKTSIDMGPMDSGKEHAGFEKPQDKASLSKDVSGVEANVGKDLEQSINEDSEANFPFIERAKWLVLLMSCWIGVSAFFCFDTPSATHEYLESQFDSDGQSISFETFFNMLYTAFSIPNIVSPLFVGVLAQKCGDVLVSNISLCILLVACTGVALGVQIRSEMLMIACRALFGIGLEAVLVSQASVLAKWFSGKYVKSAHLALAMGLIAMSCRLGTVINNALSPIVAKSLGLVSSYWLGVVFLGVALVGGIIQWKLERRRSKIVAEIVAGESNADTSSNPSLREILTSLAKYPTEYWILIVIAALFYGIFLSANGVVQAFVVERECGVTCCGAGNANTSCPAGEAAIGKASYLMSIPPIVYICLSPFVGMALDRYGRMLVVITSSVLGFCLCFVLFAFQDVPLPIVFIMQGIAMVVFCTTIWPTVARAGSGSVAVAIGVAYCVQNIATGSIPVLVAAVRNEAGDYQTVQWLFVGVNTLNALLCMVVWYLDYKYNNSAIDKVENKLD
uniref:Lysosomal dipeptide transporter MFSD1 n=1 Tax=Mucochytrium quahogii TaxID=96639 RepID=A0A7S2RWQ9_9STRA|mmetsp:Transcript_33158/g.53279  ORF Transcript_33158/g.53279 Transcript_33158/m.53279 type:complete len:508 (+) Transcript_33158:668-2191(+)|eukprot:CAMPEP_0203754132 /NCGR_PEP_ID=MMETSP0098-20131031/7770_1 /ASSEMBLY_ACC=CAM_ASM_000208 /TAXON_ID=96639 /ORGANISM=" , Strain NY0313808BC1" /LENGTH=507 /DNA_ID=CAMNT_0050645009 /DNA_START=647 /DNA_END=2170 /DNA_ORIENTATION=+